MLGQRGTRGGVRGASGAKTGVRAAKGARVLSIVDSEFKESLNTACVKYSIFLYIAARCSMTFYCSYTAKT